ncbi:dephospho-CoA kinase [candidate division WOR-3 bacterium]|nr:dephospho-CoA kinase [candidate division WOR-3 bacterium]
MIIGITGNTGSGKTLIANFFEEWGSFVISADQIGWEVLQLPEIIDRIKEVFGDSVIKDGMVDRRRLGEIVFVDEDKLSRLNKIVHPVLLRNLRTAIEICNKGSIIIDAALILEWGIEDWFDYIILVHSRNSILMARLNRLGLSDVLINGRLRAQMDSDKAMKYANFIIENNESIQRVREEARKIWMKIASNPDVF